MDSDMDKQIARLEASMAHLEHHYDALNSVVIAQGKEISRLRQQMQRTTNALESMELDRIKANPQKPPHSVI